MNKKIASVAAPPSDPSALELDARLGVQHAPALMRSLKGLKGQNIDIDASKVATVSTACLQVLLSAARSWRAEGLRLRIIEPSPGFLATLDNLGLALATLQSSEAAPCP